MAAVHALGHPSSPPPQTRWAVAAHGRAGSSVTATMGVATPAPAFLPNTPSPVALSQGSGSNLTVTWAAPAIDSTHSAASGFNLRFSPSGAGTWTTAVDVTSPYELSGLAAGAAIDVELQSANAAGTSAWSVASTLTTAAYAPNGPSVTSVTPPPDGSVTKLSVAWTAPAADSTHGAATGYNLRFNASGTAAWTTVTGVSSPYMVTGLNGAMAINVEVQATNGAANPGPWSAGATGTTWGITVAPSDWVPAAAQGRGSSVAPLGGVNMIATAAPTAVTGAAVAWSSSASEVPTAGLIMAGADGQTNGWGQWFNTPASAGVYYLWLLPQGAAGTGGALVTGPITVS